MTEANRQDHQDHSKSSEGLGGIGILEQPLVDFGRTARDYARHRKAYPASLFERLAALDVGIPGQEMCDLGTGTGAFGLQMAKQGCRLIGIDPSMPLLEEARVKAKQECLNAEFLQAKAEDTGLPTASFDIVSSATAWHWFNRMQVATESVRLLRPEGKLVIVVLTWHTTPGTLAHRTMELIERFSPQPGKVTRSSLNYPLWAEELCEVGFRQWESFAYIEPVYYSHEDWRGRVRASQGVGPAMNSTDLAKFDEALKVMLAQDFPEDPYPIDHRIEALVAWK